MYLREMNGENRETTKNKEDDKRKKKTQKLKGERDVKRDLPMKA